MGDFGKFFKNNCNHKKGQYSITQWKKNKAKNKVNTNKQSKQNNYKEGILNKNLWNIKWFTSLYVL